MGTMEAIRNKTELSLSELEKAQWYYMETSEGGASTFAAAINGKVYRKYGEPEYRNQNPPFEVQQAAWVVYDCPNKE